MIDISVVAKTGILVIWMVFIPMLAGGIFCSKQNEMTQGRDRIIYMWVSGQFVLWAAFWIISVPCILAERDFPDVVRMYGITAIIIAVGGGAKSLSELVKHKGVGLRLLQFSKGEGKKSIFLLIFSALLLFQLIQAVRMTYADGDDAYYVAVSNLTVNAETMYRKLPYTGGATAVDIRHGLAPFPVWVAFVAERSGIRVASVAHVVMPLMLIPMTYMIFYLLGKKLFAGKEQRIPFFLVFTELLVIFGDYSFYTVENFMIARSRQGKAALGSIVIPMLFLLLALLMSRLEEQKKCGVAYWGLLCCVMVSGCLCSVMGAILCCLLVGVAGACAAVAYRRWKVLIPLFLCCVPSVLCVALYAWKA